MFNRLPKTYRVRASDRAPLIAWMCSALAGSGCRIVNHSPPDIAPFQIAFDLPSGERRGIVAYAFLANNKLIPRRPADEHRFQVKYGSDFESDHEIWQDDFGIYTTLFLGINPDQGFFVAADPWLHRVTRFSRSMEFKQAHVAEVLRTGWHVWERERRPGKKVATDDEGPSEVLVGGTAANFLRLIQFEREALREDQGHRFFIAKHASGLLVSTPRASGVLLPAPTSDRVHQLTRELELSETEVFDLIQAAPRLKVAVRGWVAEEHLLRRMRTVPGVTEAHRIEGDAVPDVSVRFEGSRPLRIECKNVSFKLARGNLMTLDFQRTRASKGDPCSRFYSPSEFDVVAACTHAISSQWDFRFADPRRLDGHKTCAKKLSNNVRLDERWRADVVEVLRAVAD